MKRKSFSQLCLPHPQLPFQRSFQKTYKGHLFLLFSPPPSFSHFLTLLRPVHTASGKLSPAPQQTPHVHAVTTQ